MGEQRTAQAARATGVLAVLAAGQFLMTLDSTVMNVSISQVAKDLGTTVTGIQTAITLYTLVMASLMITGGKIGSLIGRRKAFSIGLMIYGAGSLVTAIAPSLTILILGWSLLEGIGAALIMPAIVALVASNFAVAERSKTYGIIAASGAIAVAVGPLLGGAVTTFASWRWVFLGEVVVVIAILFASRRIVDAPITERRPFDVLGALLSILGLSLTVLAVLKSGSWGWVQARPGQPHIGGLSPVIWMLISGLLVLAGCLAYEQRRVAHAKEPLMTPSLFRNRQMVGGLVMFFFQYLAQAGIFFTIPLFLSVVLELSALQTGVRLLPLSIALLVAALGVPRLFPATSPRRIVRAGLLLMIAGTCVLIGGVDLNANASVVAIPMLLLGLGVGSLASQLGAVTVSAVDERHSAEVGGLQNTAMNLGASVGTALAGAVLIAALSSTLVSGISANSSISADIKASATTSLTGTAPFISDSQLTAALDKSGVSQSDAAAITSENAAARIKALDAALGAIAIFEVIALLLSGLIPATPLGEPLPSSPVDGGDSEGQSPSVRGSSGPSTKRRW
jgi:EmrB/QacA subfamily drug resistance transporter